MISESPLIPPFVRISRHFQVLVPAVLLVFCSPWLTGWGQPLYNTVEDLVEKSILSGDSGRLIWAAAILVFLRTLIMLPYFWGAFALSAVLPLPVENPLLREVILPAFIVGPIYVLGNYHSGAPWNYLAPLFVFALSALFMPALLRHNIFLSTLIQIQLFLSFFWLDLAPALFPLGFGRGDLPDAIRMAAVFLDDERVLNLVAVSLFLSFFISAAAMAGLTALNIRHLNDLRETERREMQLERLRIQAAEARVEKEMLTLVHDLKTPLTTIQGLNSLVAMQVRGSRLEEYTRRISLGVERLNEMISEMLYDDVRKKVTVEQLIDYVRAHVLTRINTGGSISFDFASDLPPLRINFIRVVRALINLIENAITAVNDKDGGMILVRGFTDGEGNVILVVSDNGVGIAPEEMEHIWDYGFSVRGNSSGLGLAFVRQVVEKNGGRIQLVSEPNRGTTVTITFPGVTEDDQNPGDR